MLCGVVGAIAAKLIGSFGYALVYAGEYRHPLQDVVEILFMALPALLWGLAVGAICARLMPESRALKVGGIALAITLGMIGIVAAGIIWPQYVEAQRAIPRQALLDGRRVELEFELMLPPGVMHPRDTKTWEFSVEFDTDGMQGKHPVTPDAIGSGMHEGRSVVHGRVPLETTAWRRLAVIRPYEDGPDKGRQFVTTMAWRSSGPITHAELNWSSWDPSLSLYDKWDPASAASARARSLNSRYRVRFQSDP